MARLGLGEMLGAGPRAVTRYTGTLLAVFVVQTLVAVVCMFAVAAVLVQAFAHHPLWDDAVDGDLIALIACLRWAKVSMFASGGIVFGAVLLWQLATWFLVGGLYGVLAQRPEGRGDTARCFGASGASTYLAYARLALCAIPGLLAVLFVLLIGMSFVATRIEHALTIPELAFALALGLAPALLLAHVLSTASDYARIELTLRQETHNPSVVFTYLSSCSYVIGRPVTLVHGGLGWLCFAFVTIGYAYLSQGHPMYGAEGAVTLFVIRQGIALLRTAIRTGVLAGQVELGRTRPLPARRVEPKIEAKG
ncbi:MAG: hypothetical protein JWO36_2785 [Myxococcales bacterium]|nr:hypothetical protein [Myxococcales bacterium]